MDAKFFKLNSDWNADPNVPEPSAEPQGDDVLLRFFVNPYQFPEFSEDEVGILRFVNCEIFRLGSPNDHGWHLGQCRCSKFAPEWGEFYLVIGNPELLEALKDWKILVPSSGAENHYLFYFRDNTFECVARDCLIEHSNANALYRKAKSLQSF